MDVIYTSLYIFHTRTLHSFTFMHSILLLVWNWNKQLSFIKVHWIIRRQPNKYTTLLIHILADLCNPTWPQPRSLAMQAYDSHEFRAKRVPLFTLDTVIPLVNFDGLLLLNRFDSNRKVCKYSFFSSHQSNALLL